MAYNKKTKGYSTKRGLKLAASILCMAFIMFAGYFSYMNAAGKNAAAATANEDKVSAADMVAIARARQSMKQGESFDTGKAELVKVPVELAPANAITHLSELDNTKLRQDVSEREFLSSLDFVPKGAYFEEGDRLIEHNFSEGTVPAVVTEGSIIDIKLFVKGQEDRVVISKVAVVSRNASLLSFYMNELEQEYIKEAATEGMLFVVKYIDSSQLASGITYTPLYDKGKKKE
ncbi:MAG TPA: hypothetical protein VD757_00370 [Candidatus Nitrosocosmicus sp.]|nr:hypothetical protein [Candidatus Nitrosocosmicus sp.]